MIDLITVSLIIGFAYSIFTIGLCFSFRLLDYPDLTIEGSLVLGGASYYCLTNCNIPMIPAMLIATLTGFVSGVFTSSLHNFFKVNKILTGIVTAALLYSINIRLLSGMPNVKLDDSSRLFLIGGQLISDSLLILALISFLILTVSFLRLLLNLKIGFYIRLIGDNVHFLESIGKSKFFYQNLGLGISNAIIAFGGVLLVQYRGICNVSFGFGILTTCLASALIGDIILRARTITQSFVSNVIGTVIYTFIIAIITYSWSDTWQTYILASDVRFFTGILIMIPILLTYRNKQVYKLFKSNW